jgi:hypothetical protein
VSAESEVLYLRMPPKLKTALERACKAFNDDRTMVRPIPLSTFVIGLLAAAADQGVEPKL